MEQIFQAALFPINKTWGNIDNIISQADLRGIVIALGNCSEDSHEISWDSIIAIPDMLKGQIKYRYAGQSCIQIQNPKILENLGVKFPETGKGFNVPVVAMENYISAGFTEMMDWESITELGWWSTDYSGYGSLVYDPFGIEITKDWVYKNIRQIGYMAIDIAKQMQKRFSTWESYTKQKFLEERVLPFFKNIGVQIADGSYSGRPLGMKRGAEDSREIFPEKIEDLETLAGLGTFIQDWLKKQPVS